MGTRKRRERQQGFWIARGDLVQPAANIFYGRPNKILDRPNFDQQVEWICRRDYKPQFGRPGIAPDIYFRTLPIRRWDWSPEHFAALLYWV